jgi:hypothetical protein
MPYVPIRGFDGMVSQGVTPTPLLGVEEWDADIDVEVTKQGPFLNDGGVIYKVRGGQEVKGTFKGNVPAGEDTNQTAVITALTSGAALNLVLRQGVTGAGTTGVVLTIPTAIISKVKIGQSNKNGATFAGSFESNGSFTIT